VPSGCVTVIGVGMAGTGKMYPIENKIYKSNIIVLFFIISNINFRFKDYKVTKKLVNLKI
jgi:hypothetical protein